MARLSKYRAPALEKGLEILELIARETVPLSLSEISQKLGRSKSEIFRMIVALETLGYIARPDGDEGYRITNRLFMLGMAQPPIRSLQDTALPVMQAVANTVMQSCHLVVPVDDEIVVIARVDSPGDIGYAVRLGHKRPINLTASGAALFAFQGGRYPGALVAPAAQAEGFRRAVVSHPCPKGSEGRLYPAALQPGTVRDRYFGTAFPRNSPHCHHRDALCRTDAGHRPYRAGHRHIAEGCPRDQPSARTGFLTAGGVRSLRAVP